MTRDALVAAVRGFVDGKLIGTGKRGAKHNRATPRQPMIYCFSSPILVDRVLVEHFDPDYLNRTATNLWRQAFGALSPAEVDAKLADCRAHVNGNVGLTDQLRNAALLGEYLIEESAAGRLKVRYGSPYVLE